MTDKFKDVRVQFTFKFGSGGTSKGDFRSNAPHAKTPASPEKTLADVVDHFVFMATAFGDGALVMQTAFDAFVRANEYREQTLGLPKIEVCDLLPTVGLGRGHLSTYEVEERREAADPEIAWERTWKEIVMNPDGTVNVEQVKVELNDFSTLIGFVPKVYDHATGGRITKPLTWPSVVCSVIDEHLQDRDDRISQEAVSDYREQYWKRDNEATYDALLLAGYDVPIGVIPHWTDEQSKQAEDWAIALHFHACDNDVPMPTKPAFIEDAWATELDLSAFKVTDGTPTDEGSGSEAGSAPPNESGS